MLKQMFIFSFAIKGVNFLFQFTWKLCIFSMVFVKGRNFYILIHFLWRLIHNINSLRNFFPRNLNFQYKSKDDVKSLDD